MTLHPELIKRKELMHKSWDELDEPIKELPLVHGRRSKLTTDEIKKQGVCNMSPVDYILELKLALRYFGKEKMLTLSQRRIEQMVHGRKREILDKDRQNIYLSTAKEHACGWSERSPEYITLALDYLKVPKKEINKYLEERFGTCKVIELTDTYPEGLNINSMKRCIESHQIKKVTECDKC